MTNDEGADKEQGPWTRKGIRKNKAKKAEQGGSSRKRERETKSRDKQKEEGEDKGWGLR